MNLASAIPTYSDLCNKAYFSKPISVTHLRKVVDDPVKHLIRGDVRAFYSFNDICIDRLSRASYDVKDVEWLIQFNWAFNITPSYYFKQDPIEWAISCWNHESAHKEASMAFGVPAEIKMALTKELNPVLYLSTRSYIIEKKVGKDKGALLAYNYAILNAPREKNQGLDYPEENKVADDVLRALCAL